MELAEDGVRFLASPHGQKTGFYVSSGPAVLSLHGALHTFAATIYQPCKLLSTLFDQRPWARFHMHALMCAKMVCHLLDGL